MTSSLYKKAALKADEVVWREVGDELVVLELATSTYLTLNGTAKYLWLALADGATIDELVESLVGRYQITVEQARVDATSFLEALTARDLIDPDA
jgi:hypothetical protein